MYSCCVFFLRKPVVVFSQCVFILRKSSPPHHFPYRMCIRIYYEPPSPSNDFAKTRITRAWRLQSHHPNIYPSIHAIPLHAVRMLCAPNATVPALVHVCPTISVTHTRAAGPSAYKTLTVLRTKHARTRAALTLASAFAPRKPHATCSAISRCAHARTATAAIRSSSVGHRRQ